MYALIVCLGTYCMLYVLANFNLHCVASYPSFVVFVEWVNLTILSACHLFYEHPFCTNSDILLLLFLLFLFLFLALDKKRLLNALNVNYIYAYKALHHE